MKKYSIALALVMLVMSCAQKPQTKMIPLHNCIDSTHELCDGFCSCDGVSCNVFDNFYRLEVDFTNEKPIVTLIDISNNTTRVVADLSKDSFIVSQLINDNK